MEKFFHQADELLPGILLDKKNQKFKVYGRSCPVNAFEFFEPVFDWVDQYKSEPLDETIIDFYLNYVNTASSKMILKLLNKFEDLVNDGKKVNIRWFYTIDEDMKEAGEEFETVINLPFKYIEVEDDHNPED
jgi:hypothetical protein